MFDSKGIKRGLGLIFLAAANWAQTDPKLSAFAPVLLYLGGFFGVTGVAHAALAK